MKSEVAEIYTIRCTYKVRDRVKQIEYTGTLEQHMELHKIRPVEGRCYFMFLGRRKAPKTVSELVNLLNASEKARERYEGSYGTADYYAIVNRICDS